MRGLRRGTDPRVAALLDGARGERLLAWGELDDGRVVACTDHALYWPGDRVPWDLVIRGAWSDEFLDLVVARNITVAMALVLGDHARR